MIKMNVILFPTDFSKNSEAPLELVKDLATRYKSRIILLHAIERLEEIAHFSLPEKSLLELKSNRYRLAVRKLLEYRDRIFTGSHKVSMEVREGEPYEVIVATARKRKASLIVMGTHGRSALETFLIGSTAERVVKTAPCPVLTIKA